MGQSNLTVGSFPYLPGFNPYQKLFTDAIEQAGMQVVRIPPKKWFPLQQTNSIPCDVLHFDWPHDWYSGRTIISQQLKKWMYLSGLKSLKHRVVWTAHNLVAHNAHDLNYERRMIQALINSCHGIMAFSNSAKQQLLNAYQIPSSTEIRTIYHGHYADCYPNESSRDESRRKLHVERDQILFVSVGSVKPYKGLEKLIESFGRQAANDVKWIIAGSAPKSNFGQKIAALVDQAKQKGHQIEFHNRLVPDDELQVYFNAADACVLPFENVLNSGSLLLAMSFGCPVVAPAMGSIPEVVNPEWSFLYDPTSQDSLIQAMTQAAEKTTGECPDHARQQQISYVRQKYSWEQVGKDLGNWYRQLCATD